MLFWKFAHLTGKGVQFNYNERNKLLISCLF